MAPQRFKTAAEQSDIGQAVIQRHFAHRITQPDHGANVFIEFCHRRVAGHAFRQGQRFGHARIQHLTPFSPAQHGNTVFAQQIRHGIEPLGMAGDDQDMWLLRYWRIHNFSSINSRLALRQMHYLFNKLGFFTFS